MSVDPVTAEVISNKLGSVADEMSVVLIRSSVSTNIKEREDCSTSVFDAQGRLLYQAENIPLHLGSLQGMVSAVSERYGDDVAAGDMFIGNDPYEGGGTHLPDIVLVAPVFHGRPASASWRTSATTPTSFSAATTTCSRRGSASRPCASGAATNGWKRRWPC
jgi:N-methylhydantoinase B/oxoprolinase/acetone carboxylase alpha subunit